MTPPSSLEHAPRRLRLPEGQHYSCIRCSQCCRRWHVALSEAEIEHLRTLDWPESTPAPVGDPVTTIKGHPYIAHREDGSCVFLAPETGLCRIHGHFGEKAKPLGCRVYPFNVGSTLPGEASASVRMDCPAACRNTGVPLDAHRADLRGYADTLARTPPFDEGDLQSLSRKSLDLAVDGAVHIVRNRDRSVALSAVVLSAYVDRLDQLGTPFLNDTDTFATVVPSLIDRLAETAAGHSYRPVGAFSRGTFRQWLAAFLRRDEEMIGAPLSARVGRMAELVKILVGHGNPGHLGSEHPDIHLGQTSLFERVRDPQPPPVEPAEEEMAIWDAYRRCVLGRLQTLQFFGNFYYGRPFLEGLRALSLFYPLVLAAARLHAVAETGKRRIRAADVEYAVGAVDHGFGRSGLLQMGLLRSTEIFFGGLRHASLLASLDWR